MDYIEARKILNIVKCDNLGYCRDLSYTPTNVEIGQAIQVIEDLLDEFGLDF